MCTDGVYIGSMQRKQATCRVVFLQGYHVFKYCRNILKPVGNPQNGKRFKTFPNRTFSKKKSVCLLCIRSVPCLRKSEDYFKAEFRGAKKTK